VISPIVQMIGTNN